jgi:hypothetical protein
VEDGTPRKLTLGNSRFDQSLPIALHEAERVKLSVGEKWKDRIEEEIPENDHCSSLLVYLNSKINFYP